MSELVHLVDGGDLTSLGLVDYGYCDIEEFSCSKCDREIDVANDCDYIGTREEYDYFKSKGWEAEHGKPRRLYPRK